jgi:hypothetical protein
MKRGPLSRSWSGTSLSEQSDGFTSYDKRPTAKEKSRNKLYM